MFGRDKEEVKIYAVLTDCFDSGASTDRATYHALHEAKSKGFQIVIVDDGSNKSTNDIFVSAGRFGTVLRHMQNRVKRQAIKTGLSFIQSQYPADCIIVTLDVDG